MSSPHTTHKTAQPRPTDRSVGSRKRARTGLGLAVAVAGVSLVRLGKRHAAGPRLVVQHLEDHPDTTALAMAAALPMGPNRVLAVLDYLLLSGRATGEWIDADETGPRRHVYRAAAVTGGPR